MKKNLTGKKMYLTLGITCACIIAVVIALSTIANINVQCMNKCTESALNIVKNNFEVSQIDLGNKSKMQLNALIKFDVEQYDIKDIGNLSIMKVNMGIMQMFTFIVTPIHKNMPLLSVDYMYILGKRKSYIEYYDLVETKDSTYLKLLNKLDSVIKNFDYLKNVEVTPDWHYSLLTVKTFKAGKIKNDKDLHSLLENSLMEYFISAKELQNLNNEKLLQKKQITLEYTNGLIEKGGVSTDIFKKSLGTQATKRFFDETLFGTANY